MPDLDRLIDAIVRQAIEEGKLKNLKGEGKPLDLRKNPFVKEEWRMAFDVLSKEGYLLPWMEKRNEIERDAEAAQKKLARTWNWRTEELAAGHDPQFVEAEWRRAQREFREVVTGINKRIDSYNLEVPSDVFHRLKVDSARIIAGLEAHP
ncbi:MAG: DUF1992 domain-containing protein [Anaerolineae bacterium]|nr:MAG: DUF1992 domain-containing protein [Anaerolineae bacterium]